MGAGPHSAAERGTNQKWKAALWSLAQQVTEAIEGQGGSSQVAELKAVQLTLDIVQCEKCPTHYLYTDSWTVARGHKKNRTHQSS
ncbi:hypothetical protein HGM15179_019868 [Zosterops borbonicus]|uniref:Uncharacterized protein n=1 Tax=Zosterops borbonicus TaxID=364589 RepID=A0A8K1FVI9_9PASS|nr:hypothetical protein HGM15179_019868 [Zosterops borbonicus]